MKNLIKVLFTVIAFSYGTTNLSMDTLASFDRKREINFANTTNASVQAEVQTTANEIAKIDVPAGQTKKLSLQEGYDLDGHKAIIVLLRVTRQKGNKTKIASIYEQESTANDWKERAKRLNKEDKTKEYEIFHYPDLNWVDNVLFETKRRPVVGDKFVITATAKDENGVDQHTSFPK